MLLYSVLSFFLFVCEFFSRNPRFFFFFFKNEVEFFTLI